MAKYRFGGSIDIVVVALLSEGLLHMRVLLRTLHLSDRSSIFIPSFYKQACEVYMGLVVPMVEAKLLRNPIRSIG